jgi:hypothetical protein
MPSLPGNHREGDGDDHASANHSENGPIKVPSGYLEVVAERAA